MAFFLCSPQMLLLITGDSTWIWCVCTLGQLSIMVFSCSFEPPGRINRASGTFAGPVSRLCTGWLWITSVTLWICWTAKKNRRKTSFYTLISRTTKFLVFSCSYGQTLSRLARKLFDKFTREILPWYENNMKSCKKFSCVPRSGLLTDENSVTWIMFSPLWTQLSCLTG
jgi:hypothetical protein